jgi:iron complex outermembrane receptor protein
MVGVVAGVSQEERAVLYDRFQIQRYRDLIIDGRTLSVPNDVRTTAEREDRRRRSLFLGADWQVSPGLSLDFDGLVSTFDNAIREDRLVFSLGEQLQKPGATVTVRNGVVTGAVVPVGQIDNNTEFSDQAHLNTVLSAGTRIALGDWRLTPRISASMADSALDTPLERISSRDPAAAAYVFDPGDAGRSRRAAVLTTGLDLTDPARLAFQRLAVRAITSEDRDVTALIDARRPLGWSLAEGAWGDLKLTTVRLGGQVSDRSRDYQRRDREAALRPGAAVTAAFFGLSTPDDVFRKLIARGPGPWATADFGFFRDAFLIPGEADGVVVRPRDLRPTGTDLQNSYRVGEKVGAAYVRFDLDGRVGGSPLFGNLGLRWVETRTRVDGSLLGMDAGGAAVVKPIVYSGSDRELLPSLNLAFDLDEHRVLRLAASRTLTRPSLADVRSATVPASTLVSAIYDRGQAEIDHPSPGTIFSGVGGNPDLKPYLSTNLDLSWEWTFPRGALSVAVFHKRIDDYILMVAEPERLTFETRAGPLVTAEVLMSRPRNVGRAGVTGLEVGLHRRLASGLGLWASATWTDSRATDLRSGRSSRLTGVSDFAYAITPFLERGPLAINLSWSWRSAFRSEADMQGGGVSEFVVAPTGYLDAQATLDLTDRAQLVVTASNLTDAVDLSYDGDPDRLLQLGRVGRAFVVSLRWTL